MKIKKIEKIDPNDKYCEKYIIEYETGEKYEGDYYNDQKNGVGKMTYADGNTYEGEWRNDKRQGYGKYTYNI